ncbi:hypothetical protein V462_15320 [Pantoea ananatis 15320]|nr:hypothetical protein V462_15320 [Pantoea ananatis 15320]PKC46148.1 hypothetical protein V461_05415 [Pantoea ananatis BRT98]
MTDKQHGGAGRFGFLFQQAQYLPLNGNIQCGRGFIRNQQVWLTGKGQGNHDALTHSA